MIVENINGLTKITAENDKCLIRVGAEQTIEDNEITIIYLAKSLTANDYTEKEKLILSTLDNINV